MLKLTNINNVCLYFTLMVFLKDDQNIMTVGGFLVEHVRRTRVRNQSSPQCAFIILTITIFISTKINLKPNN